MNFSDLKSSFRADGFCPICEEEGVFIAESEKIIPKSYEASWFRGALRCTKCKSPPRERAIAHMLNKIRPNWRSLVIHESSPGGWAFSAKLRRECAGYIATQYDPSFAFGHQHSSGLWRNENLEAQTFGDDSFDVVITQDVFEHLFNPGIAGREIARTLKPDGLCIMTVPITRPFENIQRRAALIDGEIHHLMPEQYHGNPVSDGRSLVTIDWSYAIGAYLTKFSGLPFSVHVIDDMAMGIRDPHNVVLVAIKGEVGDLLEA